MDPILISPFSEVNLLILLQIFIENNFMLKKLDSQISIMY